MNEEMAVVILEEASKSIPAGLPDEKIVEIVMTGMKKKRTSQNDDSPSNSNKITRDYFDSLLVEERLIDSCVPCLTKKFFNEEFASPICNTALSHLDRFVLGEEGGLDIYAKAAKLTNRLHWIGMCSNEQFKQITDTGARTVRIIKLFKDHDKVVQKIRFAEECGAVAVGIDIDHCFSFDGNEDICMGEQLGVVTFDLLKTYINSTKLSFVVKGILSVQDATKAKECGAQAIVVSHHGGHIANVVPPLMVLPEIRKALGNDFTIFVDCGINSGFDAYKALALGANGVGVGTHFSQMLREKNLQAVVEEMNKMNDVLKGVMAYTGVKDCDHFDASVIHFK